MPTELKRRFRWGAVASVALCMSFGASAAGPANEIEAELEEAVESGSALSAYGAIVRDGRERFFGAGQIEPGGDTAPDATTPYQIGSTSKAFTNLLLAEMVAVGTVGYDTTVADLVGEAVDFANPAVGEITLLELATHTSGLPRLPPNLAIQDPADPYADYGEDELLAALESTRAGQPLGGHYAYSNFGAGLLGYLLGRAHGDGYRSAMTALVLEPLGLEATGFEPDTTPAAAWTGGEAVPAWQFDALAGAGALWSTAEDLVQLARIELGLATRALEHAPDPEVVAPARRGHAVSRVWHIAETADGPVYWHSGATAGHRSFFGFRPATGEAVVVLATGDLDPADPALEWFGFSPETESGALEPGMAGQYRLNGQIGIGVYEGDSGPMAQLSGQSPAAIRPIGDDWYAFDMADASLKFLREDNEIVALELVRNGHAQRADKTAETARVLSRREITMDRQRLEDYVGEYALAPGATLSIRLADEGLEARLTGQSFLRIHPRAEDVFFYKAVDAELHFERDDSNRVDALVLHQAGREQRAPRVDPQ